MPASHKRRVARVAAEFDRAKLARICTMPERSFAARYGLQTVGVPQSRHGADFYAYRDNGADILAVAHLDTVARANDRACHYVDTSAGPVVFSRALDDRLGAYVILELLPRLGIRADVLLTVGEEVGLSTAQDFDAPKDYRWMFEFDRGGTDVVMYQYEDDATRAAVRACGARVGEGILSDISYLDHLGCKGFNWGVGYRDYHSARSHAYLEDTYAMVARFLKFYAQNMAVTMPHTAATARYPSWWYEDEAEDVARLCAPIAGSCGPCGLVFDFAEDYTAHMDHFHDIATLPAKEA